MHRGTFRIDRDRYRHVPDFKFAYRLHAEISEGNDPGAGDGLGHQVSGTADGNQIDRFMFAYGFDRGRSVVGAADQRLEVTERTRCLRTGP